MSICLTMRSQILKKNIKIYLLYDCPVYGANRFRIISLLKIVANPTCDPVISVVQNEIDGLNFQISLFLEYLKHLVQF